MKDKKLEIALNDDNTISFSDYINTRIAYETVCQEKDKEIEKLNNIINELEKWLEDNIDMCDGFIDVATSDLQELGARHNGKVYYQNLLLENKIALKIYQNELNKLQELKGDDK